MTKYMLTNTYLLSLAPPSDITVVACEGDFSKQLNCPQGSKIQIVYGFYGRDNRQT